MNITSLPVTTVCYDKLGVNHGQGKNDCTFYDVSSNISPFLRRCAGSVRAWQCVPRMFRNAFRMCDLWQPDSMPECRMWMVHKHNQRDRMDGRICFTSK